ncbi:MAG TPA: penicillin-binding protein activator [Longimicrobiales bacterium]
MASKKQVWWVLLTMGVLAAACGARIAGAPGAEPAAEPEPTAEPSRSGEVTEPTEGAPAPVVGVILPRGGSPVLQRYAEYVLQGVRLAVDGGDSFWTPRVELVVLDDAGDPERVASLVGMLERQGAVAIIGPLQPQSVAIAARARRDDRLAIISPTASQVPRWYRNVYSLNAGDTQGAEALASYAAAVGLREVGILYPRDAAHRRQADAFRRAFRIAGGQITADVAFDPGTTTFGPSLEALFAARPQAIFVPAGERDVRQIAPQIAYYGLADSLYTPPRVLGGQAWAADAVRTQVETRFLEDVVAVTPLMRESPDVAWQEFNSLYERTYRSTLDNAFPALGYDAMKLLLEAIGRGRGDAADVSRALGEIDWIRGATGVLSVRNGEVVRRPFLVRIQQGELVPLTAADMVPPDTMLVPGDTMLAPPDTMRLLPDTVGRARARAGAGAREGSPVIGAWIRAPEAGTAFPSPSPSPSPSLATAQPAP